MTEYKNKELGLKGDDNILISNVHAAYQMTLTQQPTSHPTSTMFGLH